MKVLNAPQVKKLRIVDSITRQTPWKCDFFDFGKAKQKGVDYFNCGLVERPDGVWLVARRSQAHPKIKIGMNDIVCFLLEDKTPVRYVKADIHTIYPGQEHFEDPRVIYCNGISYISCCNFIIKGNGWTGAHQVICAMDDKWKTIQRYDPVFGGNGSNLGSQTAIEKNWNWILHDGSPYLIYSTCPEHHIARFTQSFQLAPGIEANQYSTPWPEGIWEWGQARGGTPAVLVGNEYWSFFHSSTVWRTTAPTRQYHMGAYAFEASPPFRITRITPEPLLSGSPFDRWGEGKPLVVFPNGSLLRNGTWTVTMGVNDLDSAFIDIPHNELLERMVKV